MKPENVLINNLKKAIEDKSIRAVSTDDGVFQCLLKGDEHSDVLPLNSKHFALAFKLFYQNKFDIRLTDSEIQEAISYLEEEAYSNPLGTLYNRVYNIDNSQIVYDLNRDDDTVVWVENGECSIEHIDEWLFARTSMFKNQVTPDLTVSPLKLPEYVKKHFNLITDGNVKLLTLYLVTCYMGLVINHPLLMLSGEKGSSKSTALRKLERLIDPKTNDLTGIPKGSDGLELRLSNSYYVTMDNLSYISRQMSDTLSRAVTGGSYAKRKLYEDTTEVCKNIKSIIAINSIYNVVKESDLLDRTLILNLKRIENTEYKTEREIWESFDNDLPKMLGCCFKCLASAMIDTEPVHVKEWIRLVDFHEACVHIGRVLKYSDEEVTELLLSNQKLVNLEAVNENYSATCLIMFMKDRDRYEGSVSELLTDLKEVAENNYIHPTLLPKAPNHLTRQLRKVESNLSQEYGITFKVANAGNYRKIEINKREKITDSSDKRKKGK
ncbi:hypothetical protein [Clostridium transplantifaecale]|uniref:hypothetical protein n=1 Tax=Clostridium transplantifaecale TaxID=2479838 RepID=UPI000F6322F5|nr:hypothetical protein [Clostridium transplantifaecale]